MDKNSPPTTLVSLLLSFGVVLLIVCFIFVAVFATGIVPQIDIAIRSGLEIDEVNGGIVVNSELMARSDLYVVCFLRLLLT
jgi:hypothetical protein